MTLQELFNLIGEYPVAVITLFTALPVLSFLLPWITGEHTYNAPWRYVYAVLIYAAVIPGISAGMLILYHLSFEQKSLLTVNLLVYFLPLVAMIATLMLLSRRLELRRIPGFERILGLFFIIFATLVTILILQKTRIWVVFYGSVWYLFGLFAVLFLVFRIGLSRMFK
jgi:hypothetical protein